ncbi:ABC transporter ATP-binding protein [bacterium]|nr:ABC transporter ATP-binding protein [bacterium]
MIQFIKVNKTYHADSNPIYALRDVSLEISPGEMTAIVGTSGSGKSTLMNMIGFMDRPSSGKYFFDGEDSTTLHKDRLAWLRNHKIGFVFQSFNLLATMTALENVALPLLYRKEEKDSRKLCLDVLNQVGLSQRINHFPNELSGGEKQRVAIARALVTKPSILLADEPTGNLDFKTSHGIMELFHQLHRLGQTIILVTHDQEIAAQCKRSIQFQDGEIIYDSEMQE